MTAAARTARVAGGARRVDKKLDPDPRGGPEPATHRTVEVAPCEKNSFGNGRICALEDCSEPVEPRKRGGSPKRFCSERCQRIAERRRYRARHTERTVCKRRGCGVVFDRSTATKRVQLYCSPECQALARSVEYAGRPDILAGVARARAAAWREGRA